jgi:hypothetical protein
MIADRFRKGGMLLADFAEWSEPDPPGASVLEQAPKKIGWRRRRQAGMQLDDPLVDRTDHSGALRSRRISCIALDPFPVLAKL